MAARSRQHPPAAAAAALLLGLLMLQGAAADFLSLQNGYFYDPDAGEAWLGRGFAHRGWAWEEGELPTSPQIEWDALAMREAGANSIRLDVHWARADRLGNGSFDFGDYAAFVDLARSYGMRVFAVLRVDTPPEWAPNATAPGANSTEGDPGWYTVHPPGAAGSPDAVGGPTGVGRTGRWPGARTSLEQPAARARALEFATAFARRFGADDAIGAVAVGSHLGYAGRYGAGAQGGYEPAARRAWAEWLRARYGNVSVLATRWGVQEPASFEAAADLMPAADNASSPAASDLALWRARSVASFAGAVAAALRSAGARQLLTYEAGVPPIAPDAIGGGEDLAAIVSECQARGAPLAFASLSYLTANSTDDEQHLLRWGLIHAAWASGLPVAVTEIGYPGAAASQQGSLLQSAVLDALIQGAVSVHILHWSDRRWLPDDFRAMGVVEAGRDAKDSLAPVSTVFARLEEEGLNTRLPRSSAPAADFAILVPSTEAMAVGGRWAAAVAGLFGTLGRLGMQGRIISSAQLQAGAWRSVPLLVLPRGAGLTSVADLAYINATLLAGGTTSLYAEGEAPSSTEANATALFTSIFGLSAPAAGAARTPRPATVSRTGGGGLVTCRPAFDLPALSIALVNTSANGTTPPIPLASAIFDLLLAPLPPANLTGIDPATYATTCPAGDAMTAAPFAVAGVAASLKTHASGARAVYGAVPLAAAPDPVDRYRWLETLLLAPSSLSLTPRMRLKGSHLFLSAAYRTLAPDEWLVVARNWLPSQADDCYLALPGLSDTAVPEEAMGEWRVVGTLAGSSPTLLALGSMAPSGALLLHTYPRQAWLAMPPAVRAAGAPATVVPSNYDVTIFAAFTPRNNRPRAASGRYLYPPMFSVSAELIHAATGAVAAKSAEPVLYVDPSSADVDFLLGGRIDPLGYRACTSDGLSATQGATCPLRITAVDYDAGVNGLQGTADGGRFYWRLRVYPAGLNISDPIATSVARPWVSLVFSVRPSEGPPLAVPPSLSLPVTWRYDSPALARSDAFPPVVLLYNSSRTAAISSAHYAQVAGAARWLERAGYARAPDLLIPRRELVGRRTFHVVPDTWTLGGAARVDLAPAVLSRHFKVLVFPGTLAMGATEAANLLAWLAGERGARVVSTSSCLGCLVAGGRDDRVAEQIGFAAASRNATRDPLRLLQLLTASHPAFGDVPPGSRLELADRPPAVPAAPFYPAAPDAGEDGAARTVRSFAIAAAVDDALATGVGAVRALVHAVVDRARGASALTFNFDASLDLAPDGELASLWAGAMAWARWPEGAPRTFRWELRCNTVPLTPVPITLNLPDGRGTATLDARPSTVCGVPLYHLAFLYPFPPSPAVAPYDQRTAVYFSDNDSPYPSQTVSNDTSSSIAVPVVSVNLTSAISSDLYPSPADVLELGQNATSAAEATAQAVASLVEKSRPTYVKPNETCTISIDVYPPYGTPGLIAGRVTGLNASRTYQIAFYLFIDNLWASRPNLEEPAAVLPPDGSFELASMYLVEKTDPEVKASIVAAFVYPIEYDQVAVMANFGVLPDRVAADALCNIKAGRAPAAIRFANNLWIPKTALDKPELPGPAYFYNKKPVLWVDENDVLKLNINYTIPDKRFIARWYSSELVQHEPLGYGNYTFWLRGPVEELDNWSILGLFTYDFGYSAARPFAFRELDFEFGRWGYEENTNFQIAVQPYVLGRDFIQRFRIGSHNKYNNGTTWKPLTPKLYNITCHMQWSPNYTEISLHQGHIQPNNATDDNMLVGGWEVRDNPYCSDACNPFLTREQCGYYVYLCNFQQKQVRWRFKYNDLVTPGVEKVVINLYMYRTHDPANFKVQSVDVLKFFFTPFFPEAKKRPRFNLVLLGEEGAGRWWCRTLLTSLPCPASV